MREEERAKLSIEKTEELLKKYEESIDPQIKEKAEHYLKDAKHFLSKGDAFSSFGASDYAFGLIEGNLTAKGIDLWA